MVVHNFRVACRLLIINQTCYPCLMEISTYSRWKADLHKEGLHLTVSLEGSDRQPKGRWFCTIHWYASWVHDPNWLKMIPYMILCFRPNCSVFCQDSSAVFKDLASCFLISWYEYHSKSIELICQAQLDTQKMIDISCYSCTLAPDMAWLSQCQM